MSATMQQIDAKAMLTGWLHGVTGMFKADINAIPDDKWNATFGGCTRPCSELTDDAIGFLFWVNKAIETGGTPEVDESKIAMLKEACKTKTGAIEMLDKATGMLANSLGSASEETLMKTANAPWGMEAPLYNFAQICISHVWYHDGQLNYVQCLLGDGAYHWNEH